MQIVADIMTREVVSVKGTTTVREMAEIFDKMRFGSLPVLDDQGNLSGIVTASDLIEQGRPLHIPTVISLFDWIIPLESEQSLERDLKRITAQTAAELASKDVVTISPDELLSRAAELMSIHKLHAIPVVDGKKVVGIVSRIDIIRAMNR